MKGDTRFRVQLETIGTSSQLLVVAAPLREADDTLHQLLIVELAVAASVLTGVLLLGLWLVRVGLRPLGRIETTAAAIAGGDLSQRVENDDPRTEVGRLGGALNTMLGQIEEAFDERTASENGCAGSSPMHRTSCAPHSPPCAPTRSCSTAVPESGPTTSSER